MHLQSTEFCLGCVKVPLSHAHSGTNAQQINHSVFAPDFGQLGSVCKRMQHYDDRQPTTTKIALLH